MSSIPRQDLELIAAGICPITRARMGPGGQALVSVADRARAIEMLSRLDKQDAEEERLANEEKRKDERLREEREARQAQQELEYARLDVEKAKVVVRALEVAAQGGVAPEQLLEAIQGFSAGLLPAAPLRQLAVHDEGEE